MLAAILRPDTQHSSQRCAGDNPKKDSLQASKLSFRRCGEQSSHLISCGFLACFAHHSKRRTCSQAKEWLRADYGQIRRAQLKVLVTTFIKYY